MKKKYIVVIYAVVLVLLFCSCGEKAAITYTDIYDANTYSAITANHSIIHMKDCELSDGEYVEFEYYLNNSGYAFNTYPYIDDNGNSVRDLSFVTNEGSYLYFQPMTAEKASFDILEYYSEGGALSIEDINAFGMVEPKYKQTITECKKNGKGCAITGENCDKEFVSMFYSLYFSDGEYADGDKVMFKSVLNEKNEMQKNENYYVFADGSEPVKTSYCEFVYDGADCPDYIDKLNSVLEKDEKNISVKIYAENEVVERKVYSDVFLLYTDCEVYSDEGCSDLLTNDGGYYIFDTSDDIAVYLKTQAFE